MPKRPYRKRKHDTLVHGQSEPNEIRCDMAVAPLDRLAIKMDHKWGIDRLPELVSVETAGKYGAALGKLNAALRSNDFDQVKHRAQVCMRGLAAMDREAEESGNAPAPDDLIEYEHDDGWRVAICLDSRRQARYQSERPDLTVFTLREVVVALTALRDTSGMLEAVKKSFPGAEVETIHEKTARKRIQPDKIPF